MATAARVLLCTCPFDAAEKIARGLLERRLVACVNALPGVVSRYWWKGTLQRDEETLLVMKTEAPRVAEVVAALKDLHPYEVPELLSLPVDAGAEPYLAWVRDETR
ncbi:MAG TPA: divalent-cation tolerance protein CutA [Planctomycetota bacterium]|nr:divalent-cation tolerance protein CutA [Planctomycetota bacterium]